MQKQYPQFNVYRTLQSSSFQERSHLVTQLANAFEGANKGEYLKPTTFAGYVFSRLMSDFMQGVQTPVDALVDTHMNMGHKNEVCNHGQDTPEYLFSFERVGNYLRTINDVTKTLDVQVAVLRQEDGYYVNLY